MLTQDDINKIAEVARNVLIIKNKTHAQYFKSLSSREIFDKFCQIQTYAFAGATIGGGIGLAVGSVGIAGGPAVIATEGVCAGVGAGIGVIVGIGIVWFKSRSEFLKWQTSQTKDVVDKFRNIFKMHPALNICLDPLEGMPMVTPVKCNCDNPHTFEETSIKKHIEVEKSNRRVAYCPSAGAPGGAQIGIKRELRVEELTVDYLMMGLISFAYKQVLDKAKVTPTFPRELHKGLELLSGDIERHKDMMYAREEQIIAAKKTAAIKEGKKELLRGLNMRLVIVSGNLWNPGQI